MMLQEKIISFGNERDGLQVFTGHYCVGEACRIQSFMKLLSSTVSELVFHTGCADGDIYQFPFDKLVVALL